MEILTIVFGIIAAITSILSIIFAILAFSRNKNKDNTEIESRLTRIETDILYIREQLDANKLEEKEWKSMIEKRLSKLEQKVN